MSEAIPTTYTIFHPNGEREERFVNWPERPGYRELKAVIEPIIGGELERVNVLDPNRKDKAEFAYTDMFVDEMGQHKRPRPPVNLEATEIYRANWLKQHPNVNPASLPNIVGVAVLFHRKVWF